MNLGLTLRSQVNATLTLSAPRQAVTVRPSPPVRLALAAILGGAGQGGAAPSALDVPGVSAGPLQGLRAVSLDASDQLINPDRAVVADGLRVLGLALTAASAQGQAVTVRRRGTVTEAGWAWSEGPVYVGDGGALTQAVPATGWLCQIGVAISATTIDIDPQPIIL